jgi:benzoyl-CoA reductase/2-hydroxyglutaryl-CoA dehydratase subunit BcrC/BadD/HgdB
LSEYYGVKAFLIDSPYGDSEYDHDYFAGEIKGVFQYLETITGKQLKLDKLREAIKRADRAHELLYQIDELKKKKPSPLMSGGNLLRVISIAMYSGAGNENTVQWLERLLEDVEQRAEKGIGGKYEEKIRIAWLNNMPSFDPAIFEWMEKRFGAMSVILQGAEDTYWPTYKPKRKHDYDYTLDELFRIVADHGLNTPMARQHRGHYDFYIRDVIHWCRDWDIDAAIYSGQVMCKGAWAIAQLTKEVLMDELGIPSLLFEIDPVDPRVTSAEQILSYMEPFLEMVLENKGF